MERAVTTESGLSTERRSAFTESEYILRHVDRRVVPQSERGRLLRLVVEDTSYKTRRNLLCAQQFIIFHPDGLLWLADSLSDSSELLGMRDGEKPMSRHNERKCKHPRKTQGEIVRDFSA